MQQIYPAQSSKGFFKIVILREDAEDVLQEASLFAYNGLLGICGDAMNDIFREFVLRRLTLHTDGCKGNAAFETGP